MCWIVDGFSSGKMRKKQKKRNDDVATVQQVGKKNTAKSGWVKDIMQILFCN